MVEIIPILFISAMIILCVYSAINNAKLFKMAVLAAVHATRYSFKNDIQIEARDQKDGTRKWVIYSLGQVWNSEAKSFDWESIPSERTDEFIRQTRFKTFDEAYKCYKKTVAPLIQKEVEEMEQKRKERLLQKKTTQSSQATNT